LPRKGSYPPQSAHFNLMEDSTLSPPPSEDEFTVKTQEWITNCSSRDEQIYSPTDIAMDRDFSYWTSQVKILLRRMEYLEAENRQLHSKVIDLKHLVSEMKKQENLHSQNPRVDSPVLQTEISNTKNLQEEMRTQQALFKDEAETQQKTINSWVDVIRKREQHPPLTVFEGVVQAKLNEERLRRTRELNLRMCGLPPPEATSNPLQIGTSFLHDTLKLKDLTLERAWMGPNSTLFLCFLTLEDRLRALRYKRKLSSLPPTQRIFLDANLTKSQQAELKLSKDRVTATQKEGKWAVIQDLKIVIRDLAPRDTPVLGRNDGLVQLGDRLGGADPPSPLVVGIVMVRLGLVNP
jgi:hypothetical protein